MNNIRINFLQDFQNEHQFVQAIREHLITQEQKQFLFDNDITIEDCLNGRVSGGEEIRTPIREMYKDWNDKIEHEMFSCESI